MATFEELFPSQAKEAQLEVGSSLSSLLEDDNFSIIQDYMSDRFGMTEDKYDRQEIVDSYINQMRGFKVGQSVVVGQELAHLYSGDTDEDREARRAKAQNAYKLFDSLGNAFGSDRTFGEKADAVYDYGRALIIDPVNLVSLGIGKLAAKGASKGVTSMLQRAAAEAGEAAVKGLGKGASEAAKQTARKEAVQKAYARALQDQTFKNPAKIAAKREVLGAAGSDTAAAALVDRVQQEAEIVSGYREGVNPYQLGFAALSGVVGGGFSYGLVQLKGTSKLPMTSLELERSLETMESSRKLSAEKAKEVAVRDFDYDYFMKGLEEVRKTLKGQKEEMIKAGYYIGKVEGIENNMSLDRAFLMGDENLGTPKGLVQLLIDAGVPVEALATRPKDKTFTDNLYELVEAVDPKVKGQINDVLQELSEGTPMEGLNLDDYLAFSLAQYNRAGQQNNIAAQASRLVNKIAKEQGIAPGQINASAAVEAVVDPITEETKKSFLEGGFRKVQDNLIRSLVTHPGTTALNLIGWKQASMSQSASDMVRSALYGGAASLKMLMGNSVDAKKYANLSRQMVSLQKQKLSNILDPYTTYEAAMDYFVFRPEAQKEMFRYLTGGVEVDDVIKQLELEPGQKLNRTKFEKVINTFEVAYGVKAQDFFSKTQEFMYSIDKQIRIKYGKSYTEFLKDPELVTYLSEKGSDRYREFLDVEAYAVQDALRNVFAKSYADTKTVLGSAAKIIEDARKFPVIGAMVPFGQFFNNTVAFMFDHSGISLVHSIARKSAGAPTGRNTMDLVTKAAVGWSTLGLVTAREMDNLDEGLPWYAERDRDGAVVNRQYDFPYSLYKLAGRMGAHLARDEKIPEELIAEFGRNFGTEGLTRQLGDAGTTAMEAMYMFTQGEFGEATDQAVDALKSSASMYISGFTRRLDPVNQIAAMQRGEDYVAVDRKQGHRWVNDSVRYVDQIYGLLSGEDIAPKKESAVTDRDVPQSIGRIVGYREVLPSSTTQKLFADVGQPDWMTGIRTQSPEAANIFNEMIFPVLELYSSVVTSGGKWESLSLKGKQQALQKILTLAKKDTMETLSESFDEKDEKASLIFQIGNSGAKKEDVRKVLKAFDVREKELFELNTAQLTMILELIKDTKDTQRDIGKILGVE